MARAGPLAPWVPLGVAPGPPLGHTLGRAGGWGPSVTAVDQQADPGVELFEPPPSRRAFSPGDAVRLLAGILLVVAGAVVASVAQSTIEGLEQDLLEAFARLPDRFERVVLSVAQLVTSVVPTVALVVLLVRRHFRIAALLVLASVAASLAMVVADAIVIDRELAAVLDALRAEESLADSAYPNSQVIASTVAVVTVAAPWLSRRWKRTLWGGVALLVLLRLVAVAQPAFDLVVALGVGTVIGSLVLLVFGSPTREPRPDELLRALRGAGYDPRLIRPPEPAGSALRYEVVEGDGTAHAVHLRTPDERDAELLNRWYRGVRYRASEVREPYATLKRRIEHEALVLTLADRAGVRAPGVERIGKTDGGSAFFVTPLPPSRPMSSEELRDPERLADLWRQVGRLHDAGIAHRHLTLESLHVDDDGRPWLVDFDRARTAPDERERARDVAELLTETALEVGAAPAVAAAVDAVGSDRVAPALRMLQPLALPAPTRARVKGTTVLDDLRAAVQDVTDAPALELEELERVKPRTVLVIGASALAFYSLLPQLANLQDTVDAFQQADLWWIAGVVLASATTYLFAAVSFQGAVADTLPFAANVRAQVAASFAGLVGPAGAGGFALTARFLERNGVGGGEAGASVAVNAIAGFAVHLTLMTGFFVWAGSSAADGFSLPDTNTVLLVAAVVLAVLGVLVAIRPVRRRFVAPALRAARDGLTQIARVFQRPERVLALFGGSFGISAAYVAAVACAVEAFGGGLSLPQIGAAYLGAVAIATLAPTPGGLGALESAMIAGFTGFGLPAGVAVSATLTFRLATFWLPILPGWLTFGWMQRNDEL